MRCSACGCVGCLRSRCLLAGTRCRHCGPCARTLAFLLPSLLLTRCGSVTPSRPGAAITQEVLNSVKLRRARPAPSEHGSGAEPSTPSRVMMADITNVRLKRVEGIRRSPGGTPMRPKRALDSSPLRPGCVSSSAAPPRRSALIGACNCVHAYRSSRQLFTRALKRKFQVRAAPIGGLSRERAVTAPGRTQNARSPGSPDEENLPLEPVCEEESPRHKVARHIAL